MYSQFIVILCIVLFIGLIIGIRALTEPYRPDFSIYELGEKREGLKPLSIILFSDFHYPLDRIPADAILHFALENDADCVLFAGDMVSHEKDLLAGQSIAERLASVLKQDNIPYLAVLGNHDLGLRNVNTGYPLLINEHFIIQDKNGNEWKILGLDDIRIGKIDIERAIHTPHSSSSTASGHIDASRTITLAHNPDSILKLQASYSKFCFSGHFHGGQIRLFGLEYLLLRKEVLCRTGHVSGLFKIRGFYHFISRGFGNVLFPLRLGARPEITLLQVHPQVNMLDSSQGDKKINAYIEKHGFLYE